MLMVNYALLLSSQECVYLVNLAFYFSLPATELGTRCWANSTICKAKRWGNWRYRVVTIVPARTAAIPALREFHLCPFRLRVFSHTV